MTLDAINDLLIEKYVADELSQDDKKKVEQAAAADESVQARIEAVGASNAEILDTYLPRQMAVSIVERSRAQKRKRTRVMVSVSAVASAAALALLVFANVFAEAVTNASGVSTRGNVLQPIGDGGDGGDGGDIRFKGDSPVFSLVQNNDGHVVKMVSGDMVSEGDAIGITFNRAGKRQLYILSLDGNGVVTWHYPIANGASTILRGQVEQIPSTYNLDDAPDFERFFMVWSNSSVPIDPADIESRLKAMGQPATDAPAFPTKYQYKDIILNKR